MKILTLDIGGSFIKYALFENGMLTQPGSVPTQASLGPEALLQTILRLAARFPEKEAVGISFASQINPTEGYISSATGTFPGFTGLPIKALLEQELGVPVSIDNDVNCAAVGEGHQGAAAGCPDFLCLTYGTGIGGAIEGVHRHTVRPDLCRRRSGTHDAVRRRPALQLRTAGLLRSLCLHRRPDPSGLRRTRPYPGRPGDL